VRVLKWRGAASLLLSSLMLVLSSPLAHSLKRFMVPIKNFTVAAGATQKIDVTVAVPVTAQAGGYFGAIRFAPASIDGSKSVNLSASVASLILLTVPGHVAEQLVMTTFDVQQNGSSGSNFRTPDGISLLMRMQRQYPRNTVWADLR
jgi:hypothetical protein